MRAYQRLSPALQVFWHSFLKAAYKLRGNIVSIQEWYYISYGFVGAVTPNEAPSSPALQPWPVFLISKVFPHYIMVG